MPGPSLTIRQQVPIATPTNDGLMSAAQAAQVAAGGTSTLGSAYVSGGGSGGSGNTLGGSSGMSTPVIAQLDTNQSAIELANLGGTSIGTLGLVSGDPALTANAGHGVSITAGTGGSPGGNGKNVNIVAGNANGGDSANHDGGSVNIQPGAPVGSGNPGGLTVAAGGNVSFGLGYQFGIPLVYGGSGGYGLILSGQTPSSSQICSTGMWFADNGGSTSNIAHYINGNLFFLETPTGIYPDANVDNVFDLGSVTTPPNASGPGRFRRIVGNQFCASQATAPTVVANTAAGTGATATLARASDSAMLLTIAVGTSPSSGVLATITPHLAFPHAPVVQITAGNGNAAAFMAANGIFVNESMLTASSIPIAVTTAPTASQSLIFHITVIGT